MLALLFGASSLQAQQAQPSAVTQSSQASPSDVIAKGNLDGQAAARPVGTAGWMTGGVFTGLLTGLIGTVVIWAVAGNSDVNVPADKRSLIAGESATYQQAYQAGFGEKLKSKRKGAALTGGLIGTATFLIIYLSATSGGSQ
ncbi:MAG TPA: hypothetical protein VFT29_03050 [Gemmatimonadaceae bacterium]|nr:hypothetical protein [Gemmatimonadaceae bacterium]